MSSRREEADGRSFDFDGVWCLVDSTGCSEKRRTRYVVKDQLNDKGKGVER